MDIPHHWTTRIGRVAAHPAAFLIVVGYGFLWYLAERDTFDFHAVATLVVWTMTLFIQRSDHRDTEAVHAKLDELLRAVGDADSDVADVDDKEPEEIEAHRQETKGQRGTSGGPRSSSR